jgi:hypothetical protein
VLGGDFRTEENQPNWQNFGNAIHALQDSFSRGHVRRSASDNTENPGAIEYIKVYAGEDREGHEHYDELWFNERLNRFTPVGRQAINATKALIRVVISAAVAAAPGNEQVSFNSWGSFRRRWLAASPDLSRERDFSIDFIEQFHHGIHLGNNSVTANMDEDGMARALYSQVSTDMRKVRDIFTRLDEHYQSDVDDIAEAYVNFVRSRPDGPVASALARDPQLVQLLIRVMDEGWTSEGEDSCIGYLRNL